jgi:hypothetical protein
VIGCGVSPTYYSLNFFLFLSGWCLTGFEIVSLVYVSEIGAQRFRNFSLVILTSGWATSQIIFPGIFINFDSWIITFIGVNLFLQTIAYFFIKKMD